MTKNKHFCIGVGFCFLLAVLLVVKQYKLHLPELLEIEQENEEDELKNKAIKNEWWLRRYADPSTGTIPTERLLEARTIADEIMEDRSQERSGIADLMWKERGPDNVGGHVKDICFDKSDLTGNTAWIATNGGGLWKINGTFSANAPVYEKIAESVLPSKISSIRQHPTNPNILYLGAYSPGGVWKSTDKGQTWTKIRNTSAAILYYTRIDVEILTDGTLLVGDYTAVYRSTDGGISWNTVFSGQFVQDLTVAKDGKIYLLTGKNIYRSDDKGINWSLKSTGFTGNNYYAAGRIEAAPSDANRLYVLMPNPTANYGPFLLYRTYNAGEQWGKVSTVPSQAAGVLWAGALAVDPNNADHLFLGGLNALVSYNGGTSMSVFGTSMHVDQQCTAFAPGSSDKVCFGNDGGLYRTSNGNQPIPTVEDRNLGLNVAELYAVYANPNAGSNELLVGAQDNGTHRINHASIGGSNRKIVSGDGGYCYIDNNQPDIQVAAAQNNLLFFTNNNWASMSSLNIGGGEFIASTDYDHANNILYTPQSERRGYAYVEGVGSTNAVKKITFPSDISLPFFNVISAVHISPNTASTIYLGNADGYVFKVQNANSSTPLVSFFKMRVGNSKNVSCISIEKGNENHVVVAFSNYGVISLEETTDGGATWKSIEGNLPDLPINWCAFNPANQQEMLLATDLGVWATNGLNGSSTFWFPISNGMPPSVQVMQLRFRESDRALMAASYGRGAFSTDYFTANTSNTVTSLPSDLIPGHFAGASSAIVGAPISLSFSVQNLSQNKANAVNASIFLSTDNVLDNNDVLLNTVIVGDVLANGTVSLTSNINLGNNIAAGTHQLILKVDPQNTVPETNENNNILTRQLNVNPLPVAICASSSAFPWHDWIAKVKVGVFSNESGKSNYTDFTTKTIVLPRNSTQNMVVTTGFSYYSYAEYWKIWIDYNQNNVFEEPQEIAGFGITNKTTDGTNAVNKTISLNIPLNANTGLMRMRISMKRNGYPTPCETIPYGEVEDYSVQITGNNAPLLAGIPFMEEIASDYVLFPNPASDFTTLNLTTYPNQSLSVELYDVNGVLVQKNVVGADHDDFLRLPLNALQNGAYWLQIRSEGHRDICKKLIVSRLY